ncbi:MFS transporter [Gordonia humi]|uniref:DHA3 family multidrug efflux protein-like MFS transporter n=1 Tax=Gordonia humi TaxID=686429 RepID=A0A840F1W4_9ACTN|nr:MFS transporter [Gordonia humi]MBB4136453.1 DHA3 family multidrug efflux protein-like MFS transporter [Gordonia humi]
MSDPHGRSARERDRTFAHILVNTAVAGLTTSYLWFALTFWLYLQTRNVIATGVIGGGYMLLIAVSSIGFGTLVDRFRKLAVMRGSAVFTFAMFGLAAVVFAVMPDDASGSLSSPWLWLFAVIVLAGAVVENMRAVALATTVTILIDPDRRANANGWVGAVQGVSFLVTSVFSGLSVGFFGMGATIVIALVLVAAGLVHILLVRLPEETAPAASDAVGAFDLRGSIRAVHLVPGLFALIVFSTFNNFVGGVHMALLDPYGLELFSVQMWGVVFAIGATGFMVGGGLIARFGLGANPLRTMLVAVAITGVLGAVIGIRAWPWLLIACVWLFMLVIPAVEAAEQTVIQRVVPLPQQGRVFGFAGAFEAAAAPVTAFVVAPIAEHIVIPWADGDGAAAIEPVFGSGPARGLALIFAIAGAVTVAAAALAATTPVYREVSREYRRAAVGEEPDVTDPRTTPDVGAPTEG